MPYSENVFGKGHSFDMEVSADGLALIARWELFIPTRYKDAHRDGFKWAIGFGHVEGGDNEPKVIPADMVLTYTQGLGIFKTDLEGKARWLRKRIKVPVTTPMFNALVSLTFNAGEGNIGGVAEKGIPESRVLTLLNEEKYIAACAAFLDHRFAWEKDAAGTSQRIEKNGLICRRATEMSLFMTKKD